MTEHVEDGSSARTKWKELRDAHKQRQKELRESRPEHIHIKDVITVPADVDMRSFSGTEAELADFDPKMVYSPFMLSKYGKDYALHARGIYYRDSFSEDMVVFDRKVWTPSLPESESRSPEMLEQQIRARSFAYHSKDNERWCKSEYAWEADAWSDVFRHLRDDLCLTIDKHEYTALLPDTDPVTCHLTGTSTFADLPTWTPDLHSDRLERLMFHPKYGLISDPRIPDIDLSFPFMVYEAKGWSGDCRVARRQACLAAATYLDMLDRLARQPGQMNSPRPYQTKTSHHYQVFVFTSLGAYWHLLVGYRRPRLSTEHAGVDGMSETVYLFQKIWSGHVIHEQAARELLSLIDQIHMWAITEYRIFVLEHLRPWHQLCEENYLLEWDSKYDVCAHKKRKRVCNETEDLMVPDWVADLDERSRCVFQSRAKLSLEEAIRRSRLVKGKYLCQEEIDSEWTCKLDGCGIEGSSDEALYDHFQRTHGVGDRELALLRWHFHEEYTKRRVQVRQNYGVMATGRRWKGSLGTQYPFQEWRAEIENIVSHSRPKHRPKRRKVSDSVHDGPS
ncbi:uncharacterized protein Z518_00298 [Rhinocladiella mackenziei CBS 650.93]|uniref:Uncharacterized protein n=1 Tax=Rhinocladiella mackenziei CBS 650.93 TaxID=1442369 RepID=A0A0D2IT54_9EURO|nr:uncharacterized protein Z518_00298 [Rhinocladiella mackenziei CBS 650.93]KIX09219.1 hypothetical protein Z518_00298 [Rhinocladiella mackenziei CBS 650.93]